MTQKEIKTNPKLNSAKWRKLVSGWNTYLVIIMTIAIAVIINLLAARFDLRVDLTKNKLYSFSDQTKQIIQELNKQPEQLKIYGFYQTGDANRDQVENLLKEYQKKGAKLRYEFIDPYRSQTLAKQYQVQSLGTLVFIFGEKKLSLLPRDIFQQQDYNGPVTFTGEEAVTRTISQLIYTEVKNIYFLKGHGEGEYNQAQTFIIGEGYKINALNLLKTGKIPVDCASLIIAGPQTDLTAPEMKLLDDYMAQGGRVMLFLDYPPKQAMIPNIANFLRKWGIGIEDSIVVELEKHSLFDYSTIIPNYPDHVLANKMRETNTEVLLPGNRGLQKLKNYSGAAQIGVFMESTKNSWGETDPGAKQVRKDSTESTGPMPLGIAATWPADDKRPESRLIVTGTSNFLRDDFISQAGNLSLFFNMNRWLLGQESRISIAPKQMNLTRVMLNPVHVILIRWLVMILLPLIIVVVGGVIWFRRRAR